MREDEMIGWHHRLNGHEFEQTPGDGEGQGSLACGSPWGRKESDVTGWQNNRSSQRFELRVNLCLSQGPGGGTDNPGGDNMTQAC